METFANRAHLDMGLTVGATLKRLAMDLQPVYASGSEILLVKPHTATKNIFLHMPLLEELVCSYDVADYFPHPPPNLKRLAMTFQDMTETHLDFCFSTSTLETLFFLRPELSAGSIDELFARYRGRHLDIVLVDVNANHVTPERARDWNDDTDHVTIWEADVPKSYYGDDEDDVVLCDGWMWSHGVQGTLWTQEKRRMTEWRVIEGRLAALYDVMQLD